MIDETRFRGLLAAIVALYLLLGMSYMLATPPLEASDEYKHYPFVQYVQTEARLPVLDPETPGRWLQEAAQPPLYYLAMAALTAWIDTSDLAEVHQVNPHAFIGNPNQVANKNLIIHRPEQEAFPWHGTVLAIILIRLASLGLGAGTVWLTARLGRLLFDPVAGLLAAALTAFNPMFLFVSAAVNNDSLAVLLATAGFYLLVRLWREAPGPGRWPRYAALGLVLGLGLLTKLSLLGLLGLASLVLALLAWRRRSWRLLFAGSGLLFGAALAVSGWWFVRNLRVYGDLTGLSAFIAVQGTRTAPLSWRGWIGELGTFYRSFWGLFGAVNVAAPEAFYTAANIGALLGTAGLVLWLWRNRASQPAGLWLLLAWPALLMTALVRWNLISPAFQGRLLFPALAALNVLWAVGLLAWTRPRWRPTLALVPATLLLITAALLPWTVIRPAYAWPTPRATVPEYARFGPVTFVPTGGSGGEIRLVGVEMAPGQTVWPGGGEPVRLVLYWQATRAVQGNYVSTVHLLGRDHASVGAVNRYPAAGMVPTSRWQPGQVWRDVYHVYAREEAAAPTRLRVNVGLFDAEQEQALPAFDPDGQPLEFVIVGEARLAGGSPPGWEAMEAVAVEMEDGIALAGYVLSPQSVAAGDALNMTLYWEARAVPTRDYTVFIHLLDAAGRQVAGADRPPLSGDYPTSWWQAGDRIEDRHIIPIPADLPLGAYELAVGLYDPITGERLLRTDGQGDAIMVPVRIEPQS